MKILNRCLLFMILSLSTYASGLDERRHIEVSGTGKITVAPDIVVWRLEMQGLSSSIDDASAELEETVIALKKAMTEAGFGKDVMKLNAVSSGRSYDGHGQKRVFKGFYAKKTATVELKELAKRGAMEKVLLKDDRVRLISTVSKSSKEDEWRRKALLLAVKDGKQKASEMAESLGASIGVVLSISEAGYASGARLNDPFGEGSMASRGGSDSSLPSDDIDFRASVLVKFGLK